jgi:uncharacterized protein
MFGGIDQQLVDSTGRTSGGDDRGHRPPRRPYAADVQPAGAFSSWLDQLVAGQSSPQGTDVPCGTCTACCRSGYFIHVGADETRTLRRIPKALLVQAPGRPKGHMVMGYDEHGRCPMLVDDACSIYADRPQTCRGYDCRIFPAAGVSPEEDGQPLIAERSTQWEFETPTLRDRMQHAAVREAAVFLRTRGDVLPDGSVPHNATDLAVLAIKVHGAFVGRTEPDLDVLRDAVADGVRV